MPGSMNVFESPPGNSGLLRFRVLGKTVLLVALEELNPSSTEVSFEVAQGVRAVVLSPRWAFQ